eukprot:5555005-Prymnesium_polylepis.2
MVRTPVSKARARPLRAQAPPHAAVWARVPSAWAHGCAPSFTWSTKPCPVSSLASGHHSAIPMTVALARGGRSARAFASLSQYSTSGGPVLDGRESR